MIEANSLQEQHTADTKLIGFDYQFYYFILLSLSLRQGQKVGFEVKDDVHIDKEDGTTILYQAKHTVQITANGSSQNLTTLDSDLWKSLSNWISFVKAEQSKEDFLNNHSFVLVTNKINNENDYISSLFQFKIDNDIDVIIDKLKEFRDKTKDKTLKGYIRNVLSLGKKNLRLYFQKQSIETGVDNIIVKVKEKILERCLQDRFVEPIFEKLSSNLHETKYLDIKNRKKFEIDFDDFKTKFGKCFQIAFDTKPLPRREFPILLPEDLENQRFIRQLLDIGEIQNNSRLIKDYTTKMLKALNHFSYWIDDNFVLPTDFDEFNRNSIEIWSNEFRVKYRKIEQQISSGSTLEDLEETIKDLGIELIDHLRRQDLVISDFPALGIELSNGHYYALSDSLEIGWHFDWEAKYKTI